MVFCRAYVPLLITTHCILIEQVCVVYKGEVEEIEQQNKDLLKENKELKESCLCLQKQNLGLQEELRLAQVQTRDNTGIQRPCG